MTRKPYVLLLFLTLVMSLGLTTASRAGTVHESATLGPVGVSNGFGVDRNYFYGSRFEVATPMQITGIGGHFLGNGNLFGAIVTLAGPTALPSFNPNAITTNAVASTTFTPANPSQDILQSLSVTLNAGWYALIFGSGKFGATGSGKMPRNNSDLPGASYFYAGSGFWANHSSVHSVRFVVEGNPVAVVPLPAALPLFGTGLVVLGLAGWRKRHRRVAA